jgi:hypothetical protein
MSIMLGLVKTKEGQACLLDSRLCLRRQRLERIALGRRQRHPHAQPQPLVVARHAAEHRGHVVRRTRLAEQRCGRQRGLAAAAAHAPHVRLDLAACRRLQAFRIARAAGGGAARQCYPQRRGIGGGREEAQLVEQLGGRLPILAPADA